MLRGTRIIQGDEARKFSETIESFRQILLASKYEEIILPSIWEQETFTNKAGAEILSQMYAFEDKKQRKICLIPEATAIVQQIYKEQWQKVKPKPIRVFYLSRCYRYERASRTLPRVLAVRR